MTKRFERRLDAEMRFHLDQLTQKYIAEGCSPDEARARAIREFGPVELAKEEVRDLWPLAAWLRDLRFGCRMMVRHPTLALTIVLTLALGIAATSTISSLIDAVLIRPLPYPDAGRLVSIQEAKLSEENSRTPVSPGRLEDWQRLNRTFDAIAGSNQDTVIDTTGPVPERIAAAFVSPRFFSVLTSRPLIGRTFTPEEEGFGGPLSLLISEGLWRRRFSASAAAIGRSITLSGRSYTIVGVLPENFRYPSPATEAWLPRQAEPALLQMREARFYSAIGRLRRGVSLDKARKDLTSVQRRLGEQYPKTDAGWGVQVEGLKDALVGKVRLALWLLFGSAGMLLLIACANVACLLLAQLNSRSAEIALRLCLGARRAAIARQLFAEGLVYAVAGGAAGMALACAGVSALRKEIPDVPRIAGISLDARMLAISGGIIVLSALLSSLAPILQTFRSELKDALNAGGRGAARSGQHAPRFLVAAQFAIATTLLIWAGLFVKSVTRLQGTNLGFRTDHVLTLRVGSGYNEAPESAIARHQRTLQALASLPGVAAVAMSTGLPAAQPTWPREFQIGGEPTPDGTLRFAGWRIVTAGYFQTLGIPVVNGRTCRMDTGTERPFEILVNQKFVNTYLNGRNPLGHYILQGPIGDGQSEIVGVVPDVREDGYAQEPRPVIYACGYLRYWPDSDFLIRTGRAPITPLAIRNTIASVDPRRPIYSVRMLAEAHREALSQTRFRTLLVGVFSMLALTLGAIGLYGVMAYTVSQRTREIGVRIALGARPLRIVGEVVRSGGIPAAAGTAVGVGLAEAASKLLETLLYGTSPSDAATYLSAVFTLLAVAAVACLIPGCRAASTDPIRSLREQ